MRKHKLAKTGIEVSELCFGTLTLGPLQRKLSVNDGLKVLTRAYERGINFYDTAQMYKTYPYLRELLKIDKDLVICTRSYDYSAEGVNRSLDEALKALDRDYVDLYLLHEQESRYTFEGHWEAIEALIRAKEAGKVRAVGFSTHRIEAVRDSTDYDELEIIFALLNRRGLGIEDGSAEEMLKAIESARKSGKAVYAMKPLGGGNLISEREPCFDYLKELLDRDIISSVALGMQSVDEVDYNIDYFTGENVDFRLKKRLDGTSRELVIDDWCEKCGRCVEKCHQNALSLGRDRVWVDHERCLTCGYCASVCPVFAIKVI